MSIEVDYDIKCNVAETPTLSLSGGSDPSIDRSTVSSGKWTASTSVPATKHVLITGTLIAGAATIDLTNMTDGALTKDFTGLKVQIFKFTNPDTNSSTITVTDGATNGYSIFGDASGQVTFPLGMTLGFTAPDVLADVSSTVKTIDLSSSDVDASYTVQIVAG